jgi:hypothetical protein
MSGEGFILDQPHQISAFVLLQIYFKMKMVYDNPKGPRWRQSPLQQAILILERNGVEIEKRTYKSVFPTYKAFLIANDILQEHLS